MPNKKPRWDREEMVSIVMTLLFIFGFILICVDSFDPIITGYAIQNVLLVESVSEVSQAITLSDIIIFALLPIIILILLLSVVGYESVELLRKTKEYYIVKKIVTLLIKYLISLVFIIFILDFFGFRFMEGVTSLSTPDTLLFGVLPLILLVMLIGIVSYGIIKLLKGTREYNLVKTAFLFLIRYVLSLAFVVLVLDFLSSKYLRLTVEVIGAVTISEIVFYAIIPIALISLIFTLIIYLLMKYVE